MQDDALDPEAMAHWVTRDDGNVHLTADSSRVGANALIGAIEWYWYEPGTPRNERFNVNSLDWGGLSWVVTSFPEGRLHAVRRLAKQLGLRVADGPPVVLRSAVKGLQFVATSRPAKLTQDLRDLAVFFPGSILPNGRDNPRIFNIENDKDSPVYKNSRRDHEAMLQASIEINTALNRGMKLTPAEIADYIYGSGDFPAV